MIQDLKLIELEEGVKIAYYEIGDTKKPTLLFIHGLANYLRVWELNMIELKNNFNCIAIDLPGNGMSSRGDYDYKISFFSNIIIQFLKAKKIKKATLVGHSMGGQIALFTALKNETIIEKLILCAPSGLEYYSTHEATLFKSAIMLGDFLNMDEVHISQSINSSFYKTTFITQKIIDDLNFIIKNNDRVSYRRMLDMCIKSMLDEQIFKELKNIKQPTLVFFGENDMLIPNRFLHPVSTKEIAQKGVKEMPNASLITYAQTGHFVQMERPTEMNLAIEKWMKN